MVLNFAPEPSTLTFTFPFIFVLLVPYTDISDPDWLFSLRSRFPRIAALDAPYTLALLPSFTADIPSNVRLTSPSTFAPWETPFRLSTLESVTLAVSVLLSTAPFCTRYTELTLAPFILNTASPFIVYAFPV